MTTKQEEKSMNIFATVLTYAAPSSNYRGESEENRTVLQKITKGDHEYTVVSPEAMRNALREILTAKSLPMNRSRLHNEDQLAVKFKKLPDAREFADDFLFGFMVADPAAVKKIKIEKLVAKRDSVLRMNLAVALTPYRFNATFHQSPLSVDSAYKNASSSALLHREVAHTAYQYPFALAVADCVEHEDGKKWTKVLLESIGELSNVAGGHARSFFEMSPKSIVVRVTRSLVAGFDTYGFAEDGSFKEMHRLNKNDLPAREFWIGGELVRNMNAESKAKFEVTQLFDSPQSLLKKLADEVFK
jgi:CRISPR-associated protein Cst2